jgi:hypothetical protein
MRNAFNVNFNVISSGGFVLKVLGYSILKFYKLIRVSEVLL